MEVKVTKKLVSEKRAGVTVEHNSIGPDAENLTSLASQFIRRGSLSPKQMLMLKRMMPKYHRHLQRMGV